MVDLLEHDLSRVALPPIAQFHVVDASGLGAYVDGYALGAVHHRDPLHQLPVLVHNIEHQTRGELQLIRQVDGAGALVGVGVDVQAAFLLQGHRADACEAAEAVKLANDEEGTVQFVGSYWIRYGGGPHGPSGVISTREEETIWANGHEVTTVGASHDARGLPIPEGVDACDQPIPLGDRGKLNGAAQPHFTSVPCGKIQLVRTIIIKGGCVTPNSGRLQLSHPTDLAIELNCGNESVGDARRGLKRVGLHNDIVLESAGNDDRSRRLSAGW